LENNQKMEKISRQIIFGTVPDTHRRKPLYKKALGLILGPFGDPFTIHKQTVLAIERFLWVNGAG
jgi:hypothetical protein